MKKIAIAGQLKFEGYPERMFAINEGLKIDIVNRFNEVQESFPGKKMQVNYWLSDKAKTKKEITEAMIKHLYGIIDAEYSRDTFCGSSMTGSWSSYDTTLSVGGHSLYNELNGKGGMFIYIEIVLS